MRFVDKKAVNAQLLKADHVVLSPSVGQLFKLLLELLLGALQLLDGVTLASVCLKLCNTVLQFLDLSLDHAQLSCQGYGDLFKLGLPDDHGIVISRGDTGAELLTVLGFKVLFGGDKDIGTRIELQILACPLPHQVIGNDKHGFGAKPQPFPLLRGGNHSIGLARTNHVCKQRISSVHDPRYGICLMLSERDFRIHSKITDVAAVIGSGTDAVEAVVIEYA